MIAAMLCLFAVPHGCYTLNPIDARDIANSLGTQVLAMAELQNRRAGCPPWWAQETQEDME